MRIVLLLAVLFFAGYVYGDGSCVNPLFVNCVNQFCQVTFLVTPAPRVDNTGICPNLAAGQSTCCDQAVFDKITSTWVTLHTDIQIAVNDLEALINIYMEPYLSNLQTVANNVQSDFPNLTPAQQTALQNYLDAIISATQTFLGLVVHDWANCARGLLNYFAGLFCFACEADWTPYVFPDGNGGYIILFDTTTCTGLTGNCLTFFQDIVNYEVAIANAAITFVDAISGADVGSIPAIDVSFSNCNQSCDFYVCHTFVIGCDYTPIDDSSQVSGATTAAAGRRSTDDTPAIAAADWNEMNVAHATVRNILNSGSKNQKLGDLTIEYLGNLKAGLNRVTDVTKRINQNMKREIADLKNPVSLRATTFTNEYNSSGYPVYSNGQNAGLDTSINSGSLLFNWISFFY